MIRRCSARFDGIATLQESHVGTRLPWVDDGLSDVESQLLERAAMLARLRPGDECDGLCPDTYYEVTSDGRSDDGRLVLQGVGFKVAVEEGKLELGLFPPCAPMQDPRVRRLGSLFCVQLFTRSEVKEILQRDATFHDPRPDQSQRVRLRLPPPPTPLPPSVSHPSPRLVASAPTRCAGRHVSLGKRAAERRNSSRSMGPLVWGGHVPRADGIQASAGGNDIPGRGTDHGTICCWENPWGPCTFSALPGIRASREHRT